MADEGGSEAADVAVDGEMVIPDGDTGVLIAEAARRREELQSRRSTGRQRRLIAGFAVAGLLLIAVSGLLWPATVPLIIVGGLLIAVALVRAVDLSLAQWGVPVGEEPCPACGEYSLREGRVAVPEASGIVALCTVTCGYAEVRPDPCGDDHAEHPPGDESPRLRWRGPMRGVLARGWPW